VHCPVLTLLLFMKQPSQLRNAVPECVFMYTGLTVSGQKTMITPILNVNGCSSKNYDHVLKACV
jgi:hypothetical protein